MKTEDTEVLGRELNQARSKPDTVDRHVKTARIFVHHYNRTQYCKTESFSLCSPSSRPTSHLRCGQVEVRGVHAGRYEVLEVYRGRLRWWLNCAAIYNNNNNNNNNKCVSRTDTNPPFAFDIAFFGQGFTGFLQGVQGRLKRYVCCLYGYF